MEQNQQPISPNMPQSTPPVMPEKSSSATLIASLIVIVLLVAGGLYFMNEQKEEKKEILQEEASQVQDVSSSDEVADLEAELNATLIDDSDSEGIDKEF